MPSDSIHVETAERRDIDAIADFQVRMADETEGMALDPEVTRAGVRGVFDAADLGFYLVARPAPGAEPFACLLVLREWSDWRAAWVWWVHSVYVAPERRRRGVYRAMYAEVRRRAREDENVRGIRLYVYRGNTGAQETYRELGMSDEHNAMFEEMF